VTDHRVLLSVHRFDAVLDGDLDEFIDTLITYDQTEKLNAER
jgi:peptide chain release factor 1